MENINHIGIAVRSIEKALPFYTEVLGLRCVKIEEVPSEHVRVAFVDAHNVMLELLEATDEKSAIGRFIEKRGEGIHHIALGVKNIGERMKALEEKGIRLLQEEPKPGAGGAQVAFMHPKSAHGVLYELCEKKRD